MTNKFAMTLALLAALSLSGCFGTEKPLFDAKSAVYPFPAGTHYIQYFDEGSGFKEYGRGTLSIKDGWYDAVNKDAESDDVAFMLKPWGKNYIVVNRVPNGKGQTVYVYGIVQPGEGGFLEYAPDCTALGGGPALKKKGLVDFKPGAEGQCIPASEAALETLMQMYLASHAKPDNKYILAK
jgi:hypothetical protein